MRKQDKKVYLKDIIDAGNELTQLEKDAIEIKTFLSNNYYFRTAERLFQIIGEALYKLNCLHPTLPISNKDQIIGLRHLIVHEYNRVDPGRLWLFIKVYLSPLIEEATSILDLELNNKTPAQDY